MLAAASVTVKALNQAQDIKPVVSVMGEEKFVASKVSLLLLRHAIVVKAAEK